jgi:hypothetical protein
MDLFWRALFSAAVGLLIWLLHSGIGAYPEPLPRSATPRRERGQALLLWVVAMVVPFVIAAAISPWLNRLVPDRTVELLLGAALLSLPYLVLPALLMVKGNGWSANDLGLTWKTRSRSVALSGALLPKRRLLFYLFALAVLAVNVLLTFTDQVGALDWITLVIDLVLLGILIVARKQFYPAGEGGGP